MYKQLIRPLFFRFDPERSHHMAMHGLRLARRAGLVHPDPKMNRGLGRDVFGLHFKNPVGLAAGFDKNAQYLSELKALGFGFVEIGTVTPQPQQGNPLPRLFRLPEDRALINRMGFNNDGLHVVTKRLAAWKHKNPHFIVGGNIGKGRDTPNEQAWKDYETCFTALHPHVDYFVVNVSSPNTKGLRDLQNKEMLTHILSTLQKKNDDYLQRRPILFKIAPDLSNEEIDDVVGMALDLGIDGIVTTNTTVSRAHLKTPQARIDAIQNGGLSGAPLRQRSTEVVKRVHDLAGDKLPIMAAGGIFTGEDAKEKLDAGAALVQVWTGFIYEGPSIVRKICKTLRETSSPRYKHEPF